MLLSIVGTFEVLTNDLRMVRYLMSRLSIGLGDTSEEPTNFVPKNYYETLLDD